nr:uncharacterized protein LOC111989564 [Quercus suber]
MTLQAGKSHSSKTPKSEPSTYETPTVHAPVTLAQSTGTSSVPHGFQIAKQSHLIANVFHLISDLERLLHSFHSQTKILNVLMFIPSENEHCGHYLTEMFWFYDIEKSKFTDWMKANALYEEVRELTYSEFPTNWIWHRRDKEWKLRKSGRCIGRIYYLWMLLNVIKGARSLEEMRTINNVVYPTFRSTCYALGLLDDDKEWHEALNHASYWASRKQLLELFLLSEDILHHQRTILRYDNLHLDDFQLQNFALCEIEQILIKSGKSLHEFETITYPNTLLLRQSNNRVLQEELDYDRNSLAVEHIKLLTGLNIDQRNICDEVIDSVLENKGGFFSVYGHGETGKTYLWKTIICRLCSEGKTVIAIASSGIAALLLPGRRTAHSRFQIPINVTDSSTCGIKQGSQIAELMTKASLIV